MRIIITALTSLALLGCEDGGSRPMTGECSSGEEWTGGDEESPLMHPGMDCIGCHEEEREGPIYTVAGTVMGDWADDDDCFGVEGVTVRITDANDVQTVLTSNAAGNFFTREDIAMPYTVVLELDGTERAMATPQSDGACNTCHSPSGDEGAPGRAVVPGI